MTRDEVLTLVAIYLGNGNKRYCDLLDVAAKSGHKVAQRLYGEHLILKGNDSLGKEFLTMAIDGKPYHSTTWITTETSKEEAQRLLVSRMGGHSTSRAFVEARDSIDFKDEWDKIVKDMLDEYTSKMYQKVTSSNKEDK